MQKVQVHFSPVILTILAVLVLAIVFFAGLTFGAGGITGHVIRTVGCGESKACVKVISTPTIDYTLTVRDREGRVLQTLEGTSGDINSAPIQVLGENGRQTSRSQYGTKKGEKGPTPKQVAGGASFTSAAPAPTAPAPVKTA